jgi:hypothetical protein
LQKLTPQLADTLDWRQMRDGHRYQLCRWLESSGERRLAAGLIKNTARRWD